MIVTEKPAKININPMPLPAPTPTFQTIALVFSIPIQLKLHFSWTAAFCQR